MYARSGIFEIHAMPSIAINCLNSAATRQFGLDNDGQCCRELKVRAGLCVADWTGWIRLCSYLT